MAEETEREIWIDILHEKHECFHLPARPELVELDGRSVRILFPEYTPRGTVQAWAAREDLLFLLLQLEEQYRDAHLGAVVVARKTGEDEYTAVVWHELFPYALKRLELTGDEA